MGRHVLLTVLALGLLAPAAAQAQTPLGQNCQARDGIRFCEGSTGSRVPTFDGVPLDVNVALPPTGTGPFPLIIQLHGYGGSKTPGTPGTAVFDRDYKAFALDGYAVLNYSARGFGNSCGSPASRLAAPAACARGNIKLADSRFEVRDSQHLAGLLVDQGIADPGRIGAMGGSYGGGQSLALAVLKDRIRLPDGSFEAWRSPNGTPLSIAAAAPFIPWSDLVYSLVPNGRTLDYTLTQPTDNLDPSGTMKLSFVTGLYAAGQATGFYAPPGTDPTADLNTWYPRILAGDPYDGDPVVAQIISQVAGFKSPFYLPMDRAPAPIFISNGFTDDLFPVDEAVRMVNKIEAAHPEVPVAQLHFDYGHMRGQTKPADLAVLTDFRRRFLARHVKGDGAVTPPTGVTALTQTCPSTAPSGGPFSAPSWEQLHPGEVRGSGGPAQTIAPNSGDPAVARAFDPVAGGGACATTSSGDQPGVATYRLPEVTDGYTLLGSPTVIADLTSTGPPARIAMRLLDVAPDGRQTLVARGLYRTRTEAARQVFQLHPAGYRFAPGHRAKLELLGQDEPYGRSSNVATPVAVSNLELRLPVADRPGGQVLAPAAKVFPPGAVPLPARGGAAQPPAGAGSPAQPPAGAGSAVRPGVSTRPGVSARTIPRTLRTARRRSGVAVRARCATDCRMTMRIEIAGRFVGERTVRSTGGVRRTLRMRLGKRGFALLRQNPRRRIDLRAVARNDGGARIARTRARPRALGRR